MTTQQEAGGLDHGWIEQGFLKRKSNYSPVIVYETTDPKRLFQLKSFILSRTGMSGFEYRFVYDHWQGLGRLSGTPEIPLFEPYKKDLGDSALARRIARHRGEAPAELAHLKASLKEVDGYLKKWKTFFLLQNVSENREWETGLQSALRSWAIDNEIMAHESTILVQTSDASSILDEFTRELAVIIPVDPSSEAERRHVISKAATELEAPLSSSAVSELVLATAGLNLHQLESTLLESYYSNREFDVATIKRLKSDLVKQSGVLEVKDPEYGFQDIGGYNVIKDFIKKYVINVLSRADDARRFALPLPKGILLFGPPGTGKSLFANALATEIKLPFINLITENIYSKWFGESGQRMRNAISMAEKMSPAIVFVDEIDRFGRRTQGYGDSAGSEERRVFSQFLEWLGRPDRQAIVVGTTNVPEHLDQAFLRTGRFDYKIPFLYPGREARIDVLLVHLGLKPGSSKPRAPLDIPPHIVPDFLREEVVPLTRNFSGAELEELVTRSKRVAFDRGAQGLDKEDFIAAARTFRVNHTEREITVERYIEQAKRFTDDQVFLDSLQEEIDIDLED